MAQQKLNTATQTLDTYSTSEQDTGKKWIDGRTIYRKVINTTFNATVNNSIPVPHGITGLSSEYAFIYVSGGFAIGTSANQTQQTLNYRESGGQYMVLSAINTTNIAVTCSFAWGTSRIIAVLEYVK